MTAFLGYLISIRGSQLQKLVFNRQQPKIPSTYFSELRTLVIYDWVDPVGLWDLCNFPVLKHLVVYKRFRTGEEYFHLIGKLLSKMPSLCSIQLTCFKQDYHSCFMKYLSQSALQRLKIFVSVHGMEIECHIKWRRWNWGRESSGKTYQKANEPVHAWYLGDECIDNYYASSYWRTTWTRKVKRIM